MSKSKKKNKKKQDNPSKTKPRRKAPIVIAIIACAICAGLIVFFCCRAIDDSSKKSELCNVSWVSSSAFNSSGDEVELAEVYNTNYTSYQGSLTFMEDGRFSLWLSPGSSDDGTHSGTYSVIDSSTIAVTFDEGTETEFFVERKNNKITSISLSYDNYVVYFTSSN